MTALARIPLAPPPVLVLPPSVARVTLRARDDVWCPVDADDLPWIVAHNWNIGWHRSTPWKFYAKRNTGAERSTVYLHREILRRAAPNADAALVGDHANGQSLDNRKANLRWVTRGFNSSHTVHRALIPSLDAIVARLAARAAAIEEVPPF